MYSLDADVADGREAGHQRPARELRGPQRGFWNRSSQSGHGIRIPVVGRLVGHVGMRVDEAGQDRRVAEVDDLCAGGYRQPRARGLISALPWTRTTASAIAASAFPSKRRAARIATIPGVRLTRLSKHDACHRGCNAHTRNPETISTRLSSRLARLKPRAPKSPIPGPQSAIRNPQSEIVE